MARRGPTNPFPTIRAEAARQVDAADAINRGLDAKAGVLFGFTSIVVIQLLVVRLDSSVCHGPAWLYWGTVTSFFIALLSLGTMMTTRGGELGADIRFLVEDFNAHQDQDIDATLAGHLERTRSLELATNERKAPRLRMSLVFIGTGVAMFMVYAIVASC